MNEMRLIPEAGEGRRCSRCQRDDQRTVVYYFVSQEQSGVSPPLCFDCLGVTDRVIHLQREEPEVDETPKRVISRARRRRVSEQEQHMAKTLGGRTQAGSGAVAGCKGDVRKKGVFRVECKSTENKSFKLSRDILDKIRSECGLAEQPALDIMFIDSATLLEEDRWVAIPFPQFEDYAAYTSGKKKCR